MSRILNDELYCKRVKDILSKGVFTAGHYRYMLEEKFKHEYGCKHVRAVTDSYKAFKWIMIYLRTKNPIGKILISSISNIHAVNNVLEQGYKPIFCDIEDDYCLGSVDYKMSSDVVAVIPSNALGNLADHESLSQYPGLFKINDSTTALGLCDGESNPPKYAGTFSDCEIINFGPDEMCGAFGGSLICTDNDELAEFVLSDLDEIRSAAILTQLENMEDIHSQYHDNFMLYKSLLPDWVRLIDSNTYFSNFPIVCRVDPAIKDDLVLYLLLKGVNVKTCSPMHKLVKAYEHMVLPNTDRLSSETFILPNGFFNSNDHINKIVDIVKEFK